MPGPGGLSTAFLFPKPSAKTRPTPRRLSSCAPSWSSRAAAPARYISKYRPGPPIYAFCDNERTERRVALYWGVEARRQRLAGDTDAVIAAAVAALLAERKVKPGELLAAVAGSPFGMPGSTNMMKLIAVNRRPRSNRSV